ncbi:endonuclease/exonuclease/phosphatase family protein [Acidovorax sp. Root219]|uniref:endonuclease/exonuclease/phosphatase family protein n=1 Tax=Acidovorax sp. Root219 TaxID=1736493 RepID=UPI000709EB4C|nr:endonuclease/exonuclease/phosphatase family protein [Acidovorax sp. Root219]KRC26601.1 endonuclease [Acidovorax sp. Root219]
MYYTGLKKIEDPKVRRRTVVGLQDLRKALSKEIPSRSAIDTLLLATWNIREFDSEKYGYRGDEQYFYIAEIISRFDLIAIQEVRDGLYPLQKLRRILGDDWQFLVTDVTLGDSGATERMAYFYDSRKVSFTGLAAELVLPKARNAKENPLQLARSPYIAGFRAGWAYLTLATVHIYYGKGVKVDPRRLEEIRVFAKTIAENAPRLSGAPQYEPGARSKADNLIILGDFNIFNREDVTMQAITEAGFKVPEELQEIPGTNVAKEKKHYDQIAYFNGLSRMKSTGKAGAFDFYNHVYRIGDEELYNDERGEYPKVSYREWRTFQMSDHLPMWIELQIDDTDSYLGDLIQDIDK